SGSCSRTCACTMPTQHMERKSHLHILTMLFAFIMPLTLMDNSSFLLIISYMLHAVISGIPYTHAYTNTNTRDRAYRHRSMRSDTYPATSRERPPPPHLATLCMFTYLNFNSSACISAQIPTSALISSGKSIAC